MRRVAAVLTAVSLGAAGCSFSKVDPDADVTITGRALDASGKPLAKTGVLLFKQADIGEALFGSVLAVGSLGSVCLLPDPPGICEKSQTATTDAEGRFTFHLTGDDTQGTLGTASTMSVVFAGRTGTTTQSFTAEKADIDLPDARLWNARPRPTTNPGALGLTWKRLPASEGTATYSVQLYETRAGAPLWVQGAEGTEGEVDSRILEARRGFAAVGATTEPSGASGAGDLQVSHLSTKLGIRSDAGTPPSRGRRCAPVTGVGPVKVGRYSSCGATDGDLTAPAHLTASGAGPVTGVVVDLKRRRPISLAVARGFAGQLLLEVSDDGRTFQVVQTGSGTAVGLMPNAPVSARYVRLRSASGLDESLGAELSIWS